MKLIRCRNCGVTIIGADSVTQQLLEAMAEADKRAQTGRTRADRSAALAQAASIRAAYKAYMHNVTSAQYAEQVTPIILQEVKRFCLTNNRLTPEEWAALAEKGRKQAKVEQAIAEKRADVVFGTVRNALDSPDNDPTFTQAARRIDRGNRRR